MSDLALSAADEIWHLVWEKDSQLIYQPETRRMLDAAARAYAIARWDDVNGPGDADGPEREEEVAALPLPEWMGEPDSYVVRLTDWLSGFLGVPRREAFVSAMQMRVGRIG